jgi:hypothetical protein
MPAKHSAWACLENNGMEISKLSHELGMKDTFEIINAYHNYKGQPTFYTFNPSPDLLYQKYLCRWQQW